MLSGDKSNFGVLRDLMSRSEQGQSQVGAGTMKGMCLVAMVTHQEQWQVRAGTIKWNVVCYGNHCNMEQYCTFLV